MKADSTSPWSAQVVVVKNPALPNKKRLCIDYSQAVTQYTEVDAYPRIDDMITNFAKYRVFSTFDLNNAYHQFPICDSDKKYTGLKQMVGYICSILTKQSACRQK